LRHAVAAVPAVAGVPAVAAVPAIAAVPAVADIPAACCPGLALFLVSLLLLVSHILPESMLFAGLPAVVDFLSLAGAPAVSIIHIVVGDSTNLLEP
jgi:hypothetical protein